MPVGAYGDAARVSFYPGQEPRRARRRRRGRPPTTRRSRTALRAAAQLRLASSKYVNVERGLNSRLDELQAAILRSSLGLLDGWNARRARSPRRYADGLGGTGLALPRHADRRPTVLHLYVVRTPRRDALGRTSRARGVATLIHYPIPPHRQEAFARPLARLRLPRAEAAAAEVLSLPIGPHLDPRLVDSSATPCAAFPVAGRGSLNRDLFEGFVSLSNGAGILLKLHGAPVDETAMTPSSITGEFVSLRPLHVTDAARTLAWRSGFRLEAAERRRDHRRGAGGVDRRPAGVGAELRIELSSGVPVGMIALIAIDRQAGRAETARFLIGEEDAVRGVPAAVEAMKLLYQIAFDELGLHRVHGWIAASNRRMITWQQYLGMRDRRALPRDHLLIGGRHEDAVARVARGRVPLDRPAEDERADRRRAGRRLGSGRVSATAIDADAAEQLVLTALVALNDELPENEQVAVSADTVLFGVDAQIDSLSLVSVIVDVETSLNDVGMDVSLTDDRAMGRAISPFTDVRALTTYILELADECR